MAKRKKGSKPKTGALVPREARLRKRARTDDDEAEALVDRVIAHVRAIGCRVLLGGAVQIGDHLLGTFFDGDVDLAGATGPTKPKALVRFYERASETGIALSLLKRTIPLALQYHRLPAAVRDRLSVSQHLALLPLDDAKEKARLAERAAVERLTEREIEEIVRERPDRPARGRPPKTELERAVPAARRALMSAIIESELTAAKIRQLDPKVRERLAQDVHAIRERLERIADALLRPR